MTTILNVIKNKQNLNTPAPCKSGATTIKKESKEVATEEKIPPHFQAVGVISAEVKFTEDNKFPVIVTEGKEFSLLYIPNRVTAIKLLKKEIEKTQTSFQKLIVYPQFVHLPGKAPQQVKFSLLGFVGSNPPSGNLISDVLKDGEFQLSGLWQFIPVCKVPCITVFRNYNPERKAIFKDLDDVTQKRFFKANHLPLFWRDSPVEPFRYNMRLSKKEQGNPAFVQVKARFLPSRNAFGFIEEINPPSDRIPRFLKVSKQRKN